MRKFYFLTFALFTLTCAVAQKKGTVNSTKPSKIKSVPRFPSNFTQGGCDTLNLDDAQSWSLDDYVFDRKTPIDTGFLTGTNFYGDLEKAQYFDASGTADQYITKAYILFSLAYSTDPSKVVPVHIYDGTTGAPGTLLGTVDLTIQTIAADVNGGFFTAVTFNPAISLPASRKFFVSVDLSNLAWTNKSRPISDTLAIYSSAFGEASGSWELNKLSGGGSEWDDFPTDYNGDLGLYIFPLISVNSSCSVLPVHLVSFNAEAKGKNVSLNWQVTQETGMKQYVVERANSNLQFVQAGTVAANNSPLNHSYSFVDNDALSANTALFYRLKQVNNDGKFSYSNTVTLSVNNNALAVRVVNPFKNAVQLQINAPFAQKMQGAVYDMLGRKVVTAKDQVLVAGQNSVTIPTGMLPKGMYMLNITVGKTTLKYKILN